MSFDLKNFLYDAVNIFADLLTLLIFLRIILSWFIREGNAFTAFLYRSTEPVLSPVRRVIPQLGMLDLSPLVTILLIELFRTLINSAFLSSL